MREIKFRAWDEGNKKMFTEVQFITSGDDGNDWILFTSDEKQYKVDGNKIVFDNPYFRQQIKLMQFTCLKDKKGVEIYEGDILCCPHFPANGSMHYLYHKVLWDDKLGLWKTVSIGNKDREEITEHGNPMIWVYLKNEKECEVVGNIYETPELIPS